MGDEFHDAALHRIKQSPGALGTTSLKRYLASSTKAAFQDFLALWKDADPDIPILKEAKAEYAKL